MKRNKENNMRHYSRAEMELVYNHVLGERLPGVALQSIREASLVKRYITGARMQIGDKVFHYAHADGVMVDNRIVFSRNPQESTMTAIGAGGVAPAGVSRVTVRLIAGGGPAQDGNMPVNYLQGGTIVFMTAAGIYVRGILTNTAVVGGAGGAMTITIDAPTLGALVATDSTEFIASRYASVVVAAGCILGAGLNTGVGVPTLVCAAQSWLWLQTWGPSWAATSLTLGVGAGNRSAFVGSDGAIHPFSEETGASQRVGTVGPNAIGGGQGTPFVNLELDP
ncbi:MAG: hypothetical protein MUO99_05660 [Dehalococcoidales bacterium]|nr:hypothetical protein [Dehalococcoidales bacterium]